MIEEQKTIKLPYRIEKININKTILKKFIIIVDERRKLREGKIRDLVGLFSKENNLDCNFDSPMVVNEDEQGNFRLIDGNHRLRAIEIAIEKNSNFSIEVILIIYPCLNRSQEREIYTKWQKGSPQSATDYLACYRMTIPLMDFILENLPVAIYANGVKMNMKSLIGCHIKAKAQKRYTQYATGGERTVYDFLQLTKDDILLIKEYYEWYSKIFGKYERKNHWYSGTSLSVLYRIWYDNIRNEGITIKNQAKKVWIKVFASDLGEWIQKTKAGGTEASKLFYVDALEALNKTSRAKNKIIWKSDIDLHPELKSIIGEDEI